MGSGRLISGQYMLFLSVVYWWGGQRGGYTRQGVGVECILN